jgi:hypothetical protein
MLCGVALLRADAKGLMLLETMLIETGLAIRRGIGGPAAAAGAGTACGCEAGACAAGAGSAAACSAADLCPVRGVLGEVCRGLSAATLSILRFSGFMSRVKARRLYSF